MQTKKSPVSPFLRAAVAPIVLSFLIFVGILHIGYRYTSRSSSHAARRLMEAPKAHGVSLVILPAEGKGAMINISLKKQPCGVISRRHQHFAPLLDSKLCQALKERSERSLHFQCFTNAFVPQGSNRVFRPGGLCSPLSSPIQLIAGVAAGLPCSYHGCCQVPTFFRKGTRDCGVFQQVFANHFYKMLYPLAQQFSPSFILDAGGNAGFSTVMFKLLWPDAIVVGLEPDPENYKMYQLNTAAFSGVFALNAGLWGHRAKLEPVEAKNESWGKVFTEVQTSSERVIDAYSVNDVAAMFDVPFFDFVKIDVEGAEGKVFQIGEDVSWLNAAKAIVMEVHEGNKAHFALEEISPQIYQTLSKIHDLTAVEDGEHLFIFKKEVLFGVGV